MPSLVLTDSTNSMVLVLAPLLRGQSAYEVAVANGFVGTEAAWLASLVVNVAAVKDVSGGLAGLTLFKLNLKNAAGTITSWFTTAATVARTWTMPDKDGTVAMTSDVLTDHTALASIGTNTHAQIDTALTRLANTSGNNSGDETGARIATLHHAASVKSALVDADEVTGGDSAASFGLLRTTWTSIKAFLKTYNDTLYMAIGPLYREDANTIAQRNGANAQEQRLYEFFTDAGNYSRAFQRFVGAEYRIGTEAAGTGVVRDVVIGYGAVKALTIKAADGFVYANYGLSVGGSSGNSFVQHVTATPYSGNATLTYLFSATGGTMGGMYAYTGGSTATFAGISQAGGMTMWSNSGPLILGTNARDIQFATADTTPTLTLKASDASATFKGAVKTGVYTVATLPSASTLGAGTTAYVTDATANTYDTTLVGGGAIKIGARSDGTNWKAF